MSNYFEIEGHKFDDKIIDIITALKLKTALTNLECGFDLCKNKDTGIIYPRNICEGTECQILTKRKCIENEKHVGGFHTHPKGSPASYADIMNAYAHEIVIVSGNKLLFYIRKIKPNRKSHDLMYDYYDKYEDYRAEHGKLNKELLEEQMLIKNTVIKTAFSVTEIIE